jgi:hypothetical protein
MLAGEEVAGSQVKRVLVRLAHPRAHSPTNAALCKGPSI